MSQTIKAIYKNGLLRPLTPLDLPENSAVEIIVQTNGETSETLSAKVRHALREAGLSPSENVQINKTQIPLTPERREELSKIFSGEQQIGDLINKDREERP